MSARLEYTKVSLHASHVRSAFVDAVRESLAAKAFEELDTLSPDQVEDWATRQGVNAPCVVEAFTLFCLGGWTK